jgi:nucleoside-diphosphate-sugar epimerase
MSKILIVGIGGFTGTHLYKSLFKSFSIIGVGRKSFFGDKNVIYKKIDDLSLVDTINTSYVIFCHNCIDADYSKETYINSIATVNKVLKFFKKDNKKLNKLEGIVYFSSLAIYRGYEGGSININSEPRFENADWYARTKLAEESIIKNFSLEQGVAHLILRPSAIVGPNFHSNLISKVYFELKKNADLHISNKNIKFNVLVGIRTIINLVKGFIDQDPTLLNKTLILSSFDILTLEEIVDKIKRYLNSQSKVIWSVSKLRGPHLVLQSELVFKNSYLEHIDEIINGIDEFN